MEKRNSINLGTFVGKCSKRLEENYTLMEKLGEGGFSEVFKIRHKITKELRSVKIIKKSSEREKKIISEIEILKNMDHPHIVKIFEYYEDQSSIYIITEYLSGGDFYRKIKDLQILSERIAAFYFFQILSGLAYLHRKNIAHLDMKLENIMFSEKQSRSSLKIIDFGMSRKLTNNHEFFNGVYGTPYYVSPEALKKDYSLKCDIWSCGVILFIILCGYPPFYDRNVKEILKKIKTGFFFFEKEDWNMISEDAKKIIKKMLNIDPSKRPTVETLLKDPWFEKCKNQIVNLKEHKSILKNLNDFKNRTSLQNGLILFYVNFFDLKKEKKKLLKLFQKIDKDGSLELSKEELIEYYSKIYSDKDSIELVEKLLSTFDFNNSNSIDITEFMTIYFNKKRNINKKKFLQIFKIIDTDNSGHITKEELKNFFGLSDDQSDIIKNMFEEADIDGDGFISFKEFKQILK